MTGAVADSPRLVRDEQGLALVGGGMTVRADFAALLPRARSGRLGQELLVRAARVRGVEAPRALDATAGLGEDAFLLAAAGFEVELYEREAAIAALLRDALARATASENPQLAAIAARMHLHEGDSVAALRALAAAAGSTDPVAPAPPDVVYLDPMFPARRKSAAVKKKLQLMQQLEQPATDEEAAVLLEVARAARPRKVVVKRPAKGPWLAGVKPSYSVEGKAVRFDVLVVPELRPFGA